MSAPVAFDETPETARGRMSYQMLLAVDAGIRGELAGVERLAAAVVDGMSLTAKTRTSSTSSRR